VHFVDNSRSLVKGYRLSVIGYWLSVELGKVGKLGKHAEGSKEDKFVNRE
jgi:hypothetical protein